MTTEEFRRHAHALVDWMADYLAGVEGYPVRAQVKPGEVTARLAESPPEAGEPMEAIFRDFQAHVLPGVTHWQHPSFFAYFPANSSPPSVLAEMLTGSHGLGAQLVDAQRAFRVHEMYAWTVALALVGLALALGFDALERRLIFWSSRR